MGNDDLDQQKQLQKILNNRVLTARAITISENLRIDQKQAFGVIRFYDRITHKKIVELDLEKKVLLEHIYSPKGKYLRTEKEHIKNEYSNAYYLAYLMEVKGEKGVPISGFSHYGKSCKARVHIRFELNEYGGHEMNLYYYCKTKVGGEWRWATPKIQLDKARKPKERKALARHLFSEGLPTSFIAKALKVNIFTVQKYVKDMRKK